MRVTQLEISRNLLTDLEGLNRNFIDVNRQLSSGAKLNKLSDSPLGSADLVDITEQAQRLDSYRFNITNSSYQLKYAESVLNQAYNAFVAIQTRGTNAANETVSVDGRRSLLNEIELLRDEIISIGNTKVDGIYIFAGTLVDTKPFELVNDPVKNPVPPDDELLYFQYNGNQNENKVPVSDDVEVFTSVNGKAALGAILEKVDGLIEAIKKSIDGTGTVDAIGDSLDGFGDALDVLGTARGKIGVSLSMVERLSSLINARETVLKEQRSVIEDANALEVTQRIAQLQTAMNAAIASGGAVLSQRTLFDILG